MFLPQTFFYLEKTSCQNLFYFLFFVIFKKQTFKNVSFVQIFAQNQKKIHLESSKSSSTQKKIFHDKNSFSKKRISQREFRLPENLNYKKNSFTQSAS